MEQRIGSEPPSVAADLRWYFTREATGPLRSNFPGMARRIAMGRACRELPRHDPADEMLTAAARAGGIARVLRAVDPETEDHLRRAFAGEWPAESAVIAGLSGLAPLTEAARRAHRVMGKRQAFPEWLRQLLGEGNTPKAMPLIGRIAAEARVLRSRAITSYLAARRRVGRHG